jgi:hypothetical protein
VASHARDDGSLPALRARLLDGSGRRRPRRRPRT